ncbi:MAG: TIGR04283 family arsenosugar biosynthesis glycosyltransferase [Rhizobacter sp.]|nr:TIGR04283 family arsenosugar biosynthesis glycosyltransferase [Ferruginibacter sp.]
MFTIIIPTYNEQDNIAKLVGYLLNNSQGHTLEIIISDGGSTDNTLQEAIHAGAIGLISPKKGRAAQMNYGASRAKGEILYFIHADTLPPISFVNDINKSVSEGFLLGRYRTKFDSKKNILKFNAFFTRFDLFMCYGGDQTLFIKRDLFESIGGFNESMLIMEDYDIITRARKKARYKIIQKGALVSARKYDTNSWLTVQKANYTIIQMYKKGATQPEMVNAYKKMLDYR